MPLTYPSTCSESYVAIGVGSLYLQLSPTLITSNDSQNLQFFKISKEVIKKKDLLFKSYFKTVTKIFRIQSTLLFLNGRGDEAGINVHTQVDASCPLPSVLLAVSTHPPGASTMKPLLDPPRPTEESLQCAYLLMDSVFVNLMHVIERLLFHRCRRKDPCMYGTFSFDGRK